MQLGLFERSPASGLLVPEEKTPRLITSAQPLRPYQQEAFDGVNERLREFRSTMVVMATGVGKTRIFTHLIHEWPRRDYAEELSDRCLVLVHREELIQQAIERIAKETGELVGLEKAEARSGLERIVVASIQTLYSEDRLHQWKPSTFGLVVYDECHHACSPKNRHVVEYFSEAKVAGFTATPDRADEKAMVQVFESDPPAYVYEIDDAIDDGWLVPIQVLPLFLNELDLSKCGTVRSVGRVRRREATNDNEKRKTPEC